ncbi:MAG: MFS transporter [Arcobacter sp.]|nr:MAG: MFS transporter [Arcobacter sp.]
MTLIEIMTFTFVAILLVVSPGPNGLLLAKTVPISGKNAGFANIAGFISAFYLHGALSILGISVILTSSAEAFFIVKVLGACYLIFIGIKALFSSFKNQGFKNVNNTKKKKSTIKIAYLEGFLTNALNPKVSMFYLAAFPQFIPNTEASFFYAFLLITIHVFLNTFWFSSMIILLSKIKTKNKDSFVQRSFRAFTGIVFIVFGMKLLSFENK